MSYPVDRIDEIEKLLKTGAVLTTQDGTLLIDVTRALIIDCEIMRSTIDVLIHERNQVREVRDEIRAERDELKVRLTICREKTWSEAIAIIECIARDWPNDLVSPSVTKGKN